MKTFTYEWTGECYILHLEFNNTGPDRDYPVTVLHRFSGAEPQMEKVPVKKGLTSFRFMVSRSHPRETGLMVEYPQDVQLEVFQLDDRAYYPTQSFFVG